MMRNRINRPGPGQHAAVPSCLHARSQASPSPPGQRPGRRAPCELRRGTTATPGRGRPRLAVTPASGRACAATGPPSPEPALSAAPAPALPAICHASRA